MLFQETIRFSKASLLPRKKSTFVGLCYNCVDLNFLRGWCYQTQKKMFSWQRVWPQLSAALCYMLLLDLKSEMYRNCGLSYTHGSSSQSSACAFVAFFCGKQQCQSISLGGMEAQGIPTLLYNTSVCFLFPFTETLRKAAATDCIRVAQ